MREFLSGHDIPFEDRNIRGSEEARAELAAERASWSCHSSSGATTMSSASTRLH